MKREKVYDIVRENIITGKVCLHVPPYTNTNKNQNLFQVIDQWKGENKLILWNLEFFLHHLSLFDGLRQLKEAKIISWVVITSKSNLYVESRKFVTVHN